ncbi:major facilitator superfamily domain-containing protein [Tricladium varicosporioides]|nr:major facilitator superfamily domain-containing protein [Hymenoscyphus varicosporioides]
MADIKSKETQIEETQTNSHAHPHHVLEIDQGNNAVLLDINVDGEKGDAGSIKLAKDNHTVLIPQPSNDPEDPLNWSWSKKHIILFIVALSAFCGDFSSGAGIPCIFPQGAEWNMDPNKVNYAGNLNVIMLGIGGIWWIPCVYYWGRAPVLFWTVLAGTFFTLGCCLTKSFTAFYALRALQGFTLTSGQTIGLAYIKDMFFFHEHARKIGLWAGLFLLSPYAGPCFANFIIDGTGDWRPVFWLVLAICCADMVLIVCFLDESWYRRDIAQADQPPRGNHFSKLIGIWQIQVHKGYFLTVLSSYERLWSVLTKSIMLPVMTYQMLTFMWSVGINITSSILFATPRVAGGYGFNSKAVGFLYLTPIVGVSIGELFGHFFNDFMANRYIKKHHGVFIPEARLWTNYIATSLMIPGLIIVGQALEKHLHYSAIVIGWGMYVVGVMLASVAITAYALDSYPTRSGEVSCFLNFARVCGGFTVGYFQQPWGAKDGYGLSFGIQALLVAVAVGILICIHRFGAGMRARAGTVD